MNTKDFFTYGERVEGYDVRVLNEREARAAAAILFVGAFLGLVNGVMLGTAVFSKYFVTFFAIDFTMRIIQPRYAPSLLLGRFFVQNQTPEYVGATQKRFAWALGFILAWPMFYYLVINWQPNPIKVFICVICLLLLIFESAFSICLGCKIYNLVMPQKASHCPGGVCEIKRKEKIQTFNLVQKIIFSLTIITLMVGIYSYAYKIENKTHIGKLISQKMMSEEDKKALEEAAYLKELADFEDDDDF